MRANSKIFSIFIICFFVLCVAAGAMASSSGPVHSDVPAFPRSLDSYNDAGMKNMAEILKNRVRQEPFNLVATIIFLCAIVHTFLTSRFLAVAHKWEEEHAEKIRQGLVRKNTVHLGAGIFEFLGEVEVVFGLWAIVLGIAIVCFHDWSTLVNYLSYNVNFTEAMFVVVIMTLASTRPVLKLSENVMWRVASLMGGSLAAWWFTILTLGPMLGSLITEPAAMTISALLLARKLYSLDPSAKFKYATIGLLFVNVSVGGTLSHFAAPPVLMVAGPWDWGTGFMLEQFGWKALIGILISNGIYFAVFRNELSRLQKQYVIQSLKDDIQSRYLSHMQMEDEIDRIIKSMDSRDFVRSIREQISDRVDEVKKRLIAQLRERHKETLSAGDIDPDIVREAFEQRFEEIRVLRMRSSFPRLLPEEQRSDFRDPHLDKRDDPVPGWIVAVHICFMGWTIFNVHHPVLFMAGLLFFLGFAFVTSPYQNVIDLKPPLLVGFFLAGIVIHGGVQGWWIAPVLGSLTEVPLMFISTLLTAFNDNAAITFLSTLVPGFTDTLKYAVVAGAVSGGGLTVIANAPNPAGQSLLKQYFEDGVSPGGLLAAALLPTVIVWLCFYIL